MYGSSSLRCVVVEFFHFYLYGFGYVPIGNCLQEEESLTSRPSLGANRDGGPTTRTVNLIRFGPPRVREEKNCPFPRGGNVYVSTYLIYSIAFFLSERGT